MTLAHVTVLHLGNRLLEVTVGGDPTSSPPLLLSLSPLPSFPSSPFLPIFSPFPFLPFIFPPPQKKNRARGSWEFMLAVLGGTVLYLLCPLFLPPSACGVKIGASPHRRVGATSQHSCIQIQSRAKNSCDRPCHTADL